MSYTQTFYHIVLRTHRSVPAIVEEHERELYSYMHGFIQNKGCHLYRIGGMPEHVHLFVSLPATLAMSKFVQELKVSSSKWLKASPLFPLFDGWTKEYAGFSKSYDEKDNVRAVQCGGGRRAVCCQQESVVLCQARSKPPASRRDATSPKRVRGRMKRRSKATTGT